MFYPKGLKARLNILTRPKVNMGEGYLWDARYIHTFIERLILTTDYFVVTLMC